MFNLIVSANGWSPNRDSIKRSRVFEYTADALEKRFKPNDVLDVDMLLSLPTVFAPENSGSGEQFARVGRIIRVRQAATDLQLEYSYDPAVPPISNSTLAELASELDIGEWEMSRTHWAIKDADLFQVLFYNGHKSPAPKVFQLSDEQVDHNLVSLMMPFGAGFNDVYAVIVEAVELAGKRCKRADDLWKHDAIIQDIVFLICTSSIVICDLSRKNANVFYEAGIAHTLGKDVILIAQSEDDIPFNLRHLRHIQYLDNSEGRALLAQRLMDRIVTLSHAR